MSRLFCLQKRWVFIALAETNEEVGVSLVLETFGPETPCSVLVL